VVLQGGRIRLGDYVGGWAKTGCKGVLDATLLSCEETVNNIRAHCPHLQPTDCEPLTQQLLKQGVSFEQYLRLEQWEKAQGAKANKALLKVQKVGDMLQVMGINDCR
jgi:hypothetical protein